MRDKGTENPCCLERRALSGAITRHFDQEQRLPGGVDVKGITSSEILSNLQTIFGDEKKPQNVPDDILLNKAFTSTLLYLYSFIQLYSGNLLSGQHSRKGSCQGYRRVWQPHGQDTGLWSHTASIQAPEGSW